MSLSSSRPDATGATGTGWRALRLLAELLLTGGLVLLLFVVHQLFWTGVVADRAQHRIVEELQNRWERSGSDGSRTSTTVGFTIPDEHVDHAEGDGIAVLWIPRLGDDYRMPIVEGTSRESLATGVGRYDGSAVPGAVGNLALAGHRATNGEPFVHLPRLRVDDTVVVETADAYYTYTVDPAPGSGSDDQATRIVDPSRTEVVAPVPDRPGATPEVARITLITCEPRWSSEFRLVVHGTLTSVRARSAGPPDALTTGAG